MTQPPPYHHHHCWQHDHSPPASVMWPLPATTGTPSPALMMMMTWPPPHHQWWWWCQQHNHSPPVLTMQCLTPNVFGTVDMEKVSPWTNVKNAPKICWKIVPTWGIQIALTIHIMQSQDYPYVKDEYKLVIAIYYTRMTILEQEMNANGWQSSLAWEPPRSRRIQWMMIISVWKRNATYCSPTPIPEQPKKQKKWLRNEGEREESILAPKCQM